MEMSSTSSQARTVRPFETEDPGLRPVHEKVVAGKGLELDDIVALYRSTDILAIGWMANYVRERAAGNVVRVTVRQIVSSSAANAVRCARCGGSQPAPTLREQLEECGTQDLRRIAVSGAISEESLGAIRELRQQFPAARVAAFTLPEILRRSDEEQVDAGSALSEMQSAGVDSLLGEGAELFVPTVQHDLQQHRLTPAVESALRGRATNASVAAPLYIALPSGDSETHRASAMLQIRACAETDPGQQAVSLISIGGAGLQNPLTTGMQELKQIAIARLVLHQVKHIRVFSEVLGSKLSQVALRFGASELDASSFRASGHTLDGRRREAVRQVQAAGLEPELLESDVASIVSLAV